MRERIAISDIGMETDPPCNGTEFRRPVFVTIRVPSSFKGMPVSSEFIDLKLQI